MAKEQKEQKKPKKGAEAEAPEQGSKPSRPKLNNAASARLRDKYKTEVVPALMKEFELKNVMAVPRLEKVVINMGMGGASQNIKVLDAAV